jgi:glycosyltransferase involved in cell wall biosynthesis
VRSENFCPKISIITPSFNQASFIEETIQSVLNQNYPNLEYIIKDAGSTDGTLDIVKKYTKKYPKTVKLITKKDNGQSDGINQGIRESTGDIIGYLNSDDVYFPNTLEIVAKRFLKNGSTKWVTGDYVIIDDKGNKIQSFVAFYKGFFRKKPSFLTLSLLNFIVQPSTFWRRSLIKEFGFFDRSLHYCMDYDFWLRIIKKYKPDVVNEKLSLFRIHKKSKGGSQYRKQFVEEHDVLKRYTSDFLLILLHKIHSKAIIFVYSLIK